MQADNPTTISSPAQGEPAKCTAPAIKSSGYKFFAKMSDVSHRTIHAYEGLIALRTHNLLAERTSVCSEEERAELERKILKEHLPHYYSDPRCGFIGWYENDVLVGGTVLLCAEDHVSVHELQVLDRGRYPELARKLLGEAKALFPGKMMYGVLKETNLAARAFFRDAFGAEEGKVFYDDEHPHFRKEDGYIGVHFGGN